VHSNLLNTCDTGNTRFLVSKFADPGGRAIYGVGLQPLDCWFETRLLLRFVVFFVRCVSLR
jgi:hypothetical protein